MGQTNSLCTKKPKQQQERMARIPGLESKDFPLSFHCHLKSLRGISLKSINVFLEIDCFGHELIKTPFVLSDSNPLWVVNRNFQVVLNSPEDCNRTFNVNLMSQKKKVLG